MSRNDEAERYRKAAHMTLDQLDWCVEYLRSLRKTKISRQIAKNRSAIASTLARREDDSPSRFDEPRRPMDSRGAKD
jgi:hypothetical protein